MKLAFVVKRLVDDIPPVDAPPVSADNGRDMRPHPVDQRLAIDLMPVLADEKPAGHLLMPDKAMADYLHLVLLAERDELVGRLEMELAFARLEIHGLHFVLGGDGVEVALHRRTHALLPAFPHARIHRGANPEPPGKGVLKHGFIGGACNTRHIDAGRKKSRNYNLAFHGVSLPFSANANNRPNGLWIPVQMRCLDQVAKARERRSQKRPVHSGHQASSLCGRPCARR